MNRRSFLPVALCLALVCSAGRAHSAPYDASAAVSAQLDGYVKRMMTYDDNLQADAKALTGSDQQIANDLIHCANGTASEIFNIQDLLQIDVVVRDGADRLAVRKIISKRVAAVVTRTENSINDITTSLANLHNPAVMTTATNLQADLRSLKQLLLN